MVGHNISLVPLIFISVLILSVSSVLGIQQNKQLATIRVTNSMPNGSEPMQIHCKSRFTDYGMHGVGIGEKYECGVREKALYYCMAITGRRFTSWHAFQPKRDGTRKVVFWLLKDDGIFFSWDNSTWVMKSMWQTG